MTFEDTNTEATAWWRRVQAEADLNTQDRRVARADRAAADARAARAELARELGDAITAWIDAERARADR